MLSRCWLERGLLRRRGCSGLASRGFTACRRSPGASGADTRGSTPSSSGIRCATPCSARRNAGKHPGRRLASLFLDRGVCRRATQVSKSSCRNLENASPPAGTKSPFTTVCRISARPAPCGKACTSSACPPSRRRDWIPSCIPRFRCSMPSGAVTISSTCAGLATRSSAAWRVHGACMSSSTWMEPITAAKSGGASPVSGSRKASAGRSSPRIVSSPTTPQSPTATSETTACGPSIFPTGSPCAMSPSVAENWHAGGCSPAGISSTCPGSLRKTRRGCCWRHTAGWMIRCPWSWSEPTPTSMPTAGSSTRSRPAA